MEMIAQFIRQKTNSPLLLTKKNGFYRSQQNGNGSIQRDKRSKSDEKYVAFSLWKALKVTNFEKIST